MEGGHQRCSLATGGHVAPPEIGHHVDAGAFGDAVGIADLQRERQCRQWSVQQGLPMTADGAHLWGCDAGALQQPHGRLGKDFAHLGIQRAEFIEIASRRDWQPRASAAADSAGG